MRWGHATATAGTANLSCWQAATRRVLKLAVVHGVRSIAFPAISCGIYGYPVQDAARIAVHTVAEFLATNQSIEQVILACFGKDVLEAYLAVSRTIVLNSQTSEVVTDRIR